MDAINLEVPLNEEVDQMRRLEAQLAHRRGHELKNDGDAGIPAQRFLHAPADRQLIALHVDLDKRDTPRLVLKEAVDTHQRYSDLFRTWMRRTKLFRSDPVIRVVTIVDPQVDGPIPGAGSVLQRDDFAAELWLKRGLLKKPEVKRLRLKGINLAAGIRGPRQNGGRVTDVGANIQNISPTDEGREGLHQVPQIVFDVAFVEEVGGLE